MDLEPRVDALWTGNFSPLRPSDFGMKDFHGRFHPEIVAQAILRYIPEKEREKALAWDPMAGGGTTRDVCDKMGVHCLSSDLAPQRPDIQAFDAESGPEAAEAALGLRKASVDILVLHPPYWSAVDYGCAMDQARDVSEFVLHFGRVIYTCQPFQKPGGHAVLVIGNLYRDQRLYPLDFYTVNQLLSRGYVIRGRIAKDFGETKSGWKNRAALMKHRALKFGFWAYDWEQVFYLQYRGK